eukprot:6480914-Amphidinium_carterae.2
MVPNPGRNGSDSRTTCSMLCAVNSVISCSNALHMRHYMQLFAQRELTEIPSSCDPKTSLVPDVQLLNKLSRSHRPNRYDLNRKILDVCVDRVLSSNFVNGMTDQPLRVNMFAEFPVELKGQTNCDCDDTLRVDP